MLLEIIATAIIIVTLAIALKAAVVAFIVVGPLLAAAGCTFVTLVAIICLRTIWGKYGHC